jgi:dolichol-phosphate mannosyltransferase
LLGNVLVPIRDCTSGFFAIRRSALEGVTLNPIGFKIGFEVMARARYKKAVEIPYVFRDREMGKSKFGRREIGQYLVQLGQVARDKLLRRRGTDRRI